MQLNKTEVNPATGTLDHIAREEQHHAEQHQRSRVKRDCQALEPVYFQEYDSRRQKAAAHEIDNLLEPEGFVENDIFARGRGIDQDNAASHQGERREHEYPVKLQGFIQETPGTHFFTSSSLPK